LVIDCLDLTERTIHAAASPAELAQAAELVRWMWRALYDILGPSGRAPLHVRLGRVANAVLGRLSPDQADESTGTEWAGPAAERALIVVERAFFAWQSGNIRDARAALAAGERLLPPLGAILATRGAERECLLTARLGALDYGILLARTELDTYRACGHVTPARVRARVERLAALRRRLMELEQAEAADEDRKGLDRTRRWNYPSPARWDRGRIPAAYQYWSSYSLWGEARGLRPYDPAAAAGLFAQAAERAARATALYRDDATTSAKWDRVVYALLHQSLIAHEAGRPVEAAVWALRSATQALSETLEGDTQGLALACQIEIADMLQRLIPLCTRNDSTGTRLTTAEMQAVTREIAAFVQARDAQDRSEVGLWAQGSALERIASSPRQPSQFPAYLNAWSTAFIRAVVEIARVQPPRARREIMAQVQRIAPELAPTMQPSRGRSRRRVAGTSAAP
jgi:hypothetical protein